MANIWGDLYGGIKSTVKQAKDAYIEVEKAKRMRPTNAGATQQASLNSSDQEDQLGQEPMSSDQYMSAAQRARAKYAGGMGGVWQGLRPWQKGALGVAGLLGAGLAAKKLMKG